MLYTHSYSDNIILERIKNLQQDSLVSLYEAHYLPALNYIVKNGGDEVATQQALSGALVQLWREVLANKYEAEGPIEQFVLARTRELFHKRKVKKSQRAESEEEKRNEKRERMAQLFGLLDAKERDILHLYYFEGLDFENIAKAKSLGSAAAARQALDAAWGKLDKISIIMFNQQNDKA